MDSLCFIAYGVEVLHQIIFNDGPNWRKGGNDRNQHTNNESSDHCAKCGSYIVRIAKEWLENATDHAKNKIGERKRNKVWEQYILKRWKEQVKYNKSSARSHCFKESKIEAFPISAHQHHVIHHENTEDKQTCDDQLEDDSNEHPEIAHLN